MRYERLDRTRWKVSAGCVRWETDRYMVPVSKIRNPFAGRRWWALTVGRLKIQWY